MDCEKFDTVTMDLLYGELDELSEAAALRHLHHCTRCRDIWGHLRTTRELSEIPQEDAPADLFETVMAAELNAKKTLPLRERASRVISIMAEYAMRPQLAMAALLLLMIGSSLIFVRTGPNDHGQVRVTELGTPTSEGTTRSKSKDETLVFEGDRTSTERPSEGEADESVHQVAGIDEALEKEQSTSAPRGGDTYREAMAAYQEGRYAEAERLFSEVASQGDERAASAALHEGHAARNGSGCQRAAALYDSVAARFEGSTVADEASWHAATCYRAMGQLKRAAAHYAQLQERPAYSARAEKALSEIEGLEKLAAKKDAAPEDSAASKTAEPEPPAAPQAPAKPGSSPAAGKAAPVEAPKAAPKLDQKNLQNSL